ncbi:MAG: hypothetical protein IKI93_03270, partial [Clostridia bacterium]|nr:hypothetical protein [Clostridia bacterium]
KRWYLYLLTVDEDHYACIFLEPEDVLVVPENEQEILDAMVASVEIDITRTSEENWKKCAESHTVSGQKFNVAFTCPEKWQIENSGILNDENGKRIGERVFREGFSFEEFRQESSFSNGHSVLNNSDSPYQGSTDSDMEYIGYHKSVQSSIDYSSAEVYTFLVQYNDSMFMHISVWQHETDAYEDFLHSVVLPIINSVTIEKVGNDNIAPSVSTVDPDTIWQTFRDTVVSPYSEYIVATEYLDLDGNGIDELIIYDWGASASCGIEIFTIENGEVRSFSTGTNGITHYSEEAKSLAPPSANADAYSFWGLPTSYADRSDTVLWFVPCDYRKRNGHVLYSMNGSDVHTSEDYYYFTSDENGLLTVELLCSFRCEAIDSNPANGWKCYINGEEVNVRWFRDTMGFFWQDLSVSHGVQYHDKNTASRYEELESWVEDHSEEILQPEEEVPEGIVFVDEDSAPYTYTREEWIKYTLSTDFGFREPVDVSALTDDELTSYIADAFRCASEIWSLFLVSSDRMYARNVWRSDMPQVEINGRYYSQMFNPVFPTLADLESYMNGVLSHDLTKQLLSMGMFIDYEGELWGLMGARGTDISKKTVGFSVTSRTDTEIIYTAEVEVREHDLSAEEPDYVEYHDFTYSLTEDGWRWTDFYLYN